MMLLCAEETVDDVFNVTLVTICYVFIQLKKHLMIF